MIELILSVAFILCEVLGTCVFGGRCIKYDYSRVHILTNDGKNMISDDISKIKRKYNMIIIDKKDEQIKIRFDCIIRVEYGGEPMIVLTENPFLLRK